jgi:hypothetical protein
MKLLFTRGDIDVRDAERLAGDHERFYEANLGIVNATSAATYVMARESNGYEGYLRFIFPARHKKMFRDRRASCIFTSRREVKPLTGSRSSTWLPTDPQDLTSRERYGRIASPSLYRPRAC